MYEAARVKAATASDVADTDGKSGIADRASAMVDILCVRESGQGGSETDELVDVLRLARYMAFQGHGHYGDRYRRGADEDMAQTRSRPRSPSSPCGVRKKIPRGLRRQPPQASGCASWSACPRTNGVKKHPAYHSLMKGWQKQGRLTYFVGRAITVTLRKGKEASLTMVLDRVNEAENTQASPNPETSGETTSRRHVVRGTT